LEVGGEMKHKLFRPHMSKIMKQSAVAGEMPVEIYLPEPVELNMESLELFFGQ